MRKNGGLFFEEEDLRTCKLFEARRITQPPSTGGQGFTAMLAGPSVGILPLHGQAGAAHQALQIQYALVHARGQGPPPKGQPDD
jgi:hypothetical protein